MQMLAFEKGQEVLGPYQVRGPITATKVSSYLEREGSGVMGDLTWLDPRERRSDGIGTRE